MISKNPDYPRAAGALGVSDALLTTRCKGKYVLQADGSCKLLSIQEFSQPRFRPPGWELCDSQHSEHQHTPEDNEDGSDGSDIVLDASERWSFENVMRAVRRAKIGAFDLILCNPDLDAFVTLTLDPTKVSDRSSWDSAYGAIKAWLSNRVQRNGLKYVLISEYHKKGNAIHFHSMMNSAALRLIEARYPKNGRLIKDKGQQVYNLADYYAGFSTAKIITGESSTDKVAKYIFKYMGKQINNKIGGRYYLHGGDLRKPIYRYSDDPDELLLPGAVPTFTKEVEVTENLRYKEVCFV